MPANPQYILPLSPRYCYREGSVGVSVGDSATLVLPCPINGRILGVAAAQSVSTDATLSVDLGGVPVTGLDNVAMGTADTTYTALATANNTISYNNAGEEMGPLRVTFTNNGLLAAWFTVRVDMESAR